MEMNDVVTASVHKEGMRRGKRVGFFFLSLTPAIANLFLQLVLGGIYMIIVGVATVITYQAANPLATTQEIMDVSMEAVYGAMAGGVMFCHLLSIPIFGLWYYFGCNRPKMKQSVKNISLKTIVIAVTGGIVLCLLTNGIVGVEQYLIPNAIEEFAELMENVGMGDDILANIAAILFAPIGEELVCRGLILYYAKKALPRFWMANVLQALMFSLIHMNLIQGIYAFVIGLFLGYLAERYQSLLPCVLVHFVINFSTLVWIDKVFFWIPDSLLSYLILCIVTTGLIIALLWWAGPIKKMFHETSNGNARE